MAIIRANEAGIFFEVGGYGPPDLGVTSFRGVEGISELFEWEINLIHRDNDLDFDAVVGQEGTLRFEGPVEIRIVHGIVSSFEQLGSGPRLNHYRARLVPRLWLAGLRTDCRIFQAKKVPDILTTVLQKHGITGDKLRMDVGSTGHPEREYCVQYRESDLDFFMRLCEEEGMCFFFEHTEGNHCLVVSDKSSIFVDISGDATVPYRSRDNMVEDEGTEAIYDLRYSKSVRSGKVSIQDYEFKRPSTSLATNSAAGEETDLEVYDYPGEYFVKGDGDALAKIRLEELRTSKVSIWGFSGCRRFLPGFKFTLAEHPRDDRNAQYLITRVEHWGNQPEASEEDAGATGAGGSSEEEAPYGNRFESLPGDVAYRPARVTPRPRVDGPHTAMVVGPPGEEIWPDEHGRVKVQFHWDRLGANDDKSSCWIRVSQGWAGLGMGSFFLPRIKQEVVVSFLEGNPDAPLITGRVYNAESTPPYPLPDEKTKSTIRTESSPGGGGYNELRFEDAAGAEEIYIHGQKDENIVIENDKTQLIGHDETLEVKRDRTRTVQRDHYLTVNRNQEMKVVGNDQIQIDGNQSTTILGNETIVIGGSRGEVVGGSSTIGITGTFGLTVGDATTISIAANCTESIDGASTQDVSGDATATIGGADSRDVSGAYTLTVGGAGSIDIGGALAVSAGGATTINSDGPMKITAPKFELTADDEIKFVTGSAEITMKSGGDITIKGSKISVEASGDMTLKGSSIKQN